MPMIVLMIAANLASMTFGAGYLLQVRRKNGPAPALVWQNSPAVSERLLIDAIFREADGNRDGLLSGEEASAAAEHFVHRTDAKGNGSIDAQSLAKALMNVEFHGRGRGARYARAIERDSSQSARLPDQAPPGGTNLFDQVEKLGPPTPTELKDHVSAHDDSHPDDTSKVEPVHSVR